ncbi:MAG: hypothetical protein KGN84_02215 [Acidobacteriota bacterium]|nr:hypothetical protein [Acidobacteriota bacterium]
MIQQQKLPLWRLITGFAILAGFAAVIAFLAPVYIDNYRLGRYMRDLAASGANTNDDQLRGQVLDRAHRLDLPLVTGDIEVTRPNGGVLLETHYKVKMDFGIYPVDLHLSAKSR